MLPNLKLSKLGIFKKFVCGPKTILVKFSTQGRTDNPSYILVSALKILFTLHALMVKVQCGVIIN